MSYIDIIIPLLAGLAFIAIPDKLIKTRDATYEKKKVSTKKSGLYSYFCCGTLLYHQNFWAIKQQPTLV